MNIYIKYFTRNITKSQFNEYLLNIHNKNMYNFINIIKFYYKFNYLQDIDYEHISNYFKNISKEVLNDLSNYLSFIFYNPYLYYLSYLNRNNKDLLENYSQFLRNMYPILNYNHIENRSNSNKTINNKTKNNKTKNNKIKIGFIGFKLLRNGRTSVYNDRSEIIKRLDPNIYEKYLIISNKDYKITDEKFKIEIGKLYNSVDYIYEIGETLNIDSLNLTIDLINSYKKIGFLNLDIIVFTDIGMDIRSNIIASMRLAPIQITTWGHSVTSGINTVDYYISSKYYELDDLNKAQTHYSEKLLALNSLCTYYLKPECEILFDKNALNLPLDRPILSCLQMPCKIDKEYLKILNKIIMNNPNVVILLLKTYDNYDNIDLIKNIVYDNTKLKDNLIFINKTKKNKFLNYINVSDLILDPYPFGGCNTSFEAFSLNKIVITRPSDFLAGRFTYGFYKKMGITNPIAYSEEEYINKVSYYLNNTDEKEKLENEIKEKNHLLFNDQESVDEWDKVLMYLYDKDIKNVQNEQLTKHQTNHQTKLLYTVFVNEKQYFESLKQLTELNIDNYLIVVINHKIHKNILRRKTLHLKINSKYSLSELFIIFLHEYVRLEEFNEYTHICKMYFNNLCELMDLKELKELKELKDLKELKELKDLNNIQLKDHYFSYNFKDNLSNLDNDNIKINKIEYSIYKTNTSYLDKNIILSRESLINIKNIVDIDNLHLYNYTNENELIKKIMDLINFKVSLV
jgi:hypothetical protein